MSEPAMYNDYPPNIINRLVQEKNWLEAEQFRLNEENKHLSDENRNLREAIGDRRGEYRGVQVAEMKTNPVAGANNHVPHVTAFLAMLRNLHPELEWKCLHGSCFRLYLLLKEVWPDAEAWTNIDHVITKIDGTFYDIRGEVDPTGYLRMKDDANAFNRAYYWGTEIQDRMIEQEMEKRTHDQTRTI